jgi:hypothetical protein
MQTLQPVLLPPMSFLGAIKRELFQGDLHLEGTMMPPSSHLVSCVSLVF